MKNKKKAFTLTELLVVVIVIGVLSAAVLPKFSKVIETRKTTEAEELMASIRTEQEKRCALDKQYIADDISRLNDIVKNPDTKNYKITLQGTGVIASSKGNYSYTLEMPSYLDGRICCRGNDCEKLNKNYPNCDVGFTYEPSPESCAGTPPPPDPEPKSCTDTAVTERACTSGCGTEHRTATCNTSTGNWEYSAWDNSCTAKPASESRECGTGYTGTQTRSAVCKDGAWEMGDWTGTCTAETCDPDGSKYRDCQSLMELEWDCEGGGPGVTKWNAETCECEDYCWTPSDCSWSYGDCPEGTDYNNDTCNGDTRKLFNETLEFVAGGSTTCIDIYGRAANTGGSSGSGCYNDPYHPTTCGAGQTGACINGKWTCYTPCPRGGCAGGATNPMPDPQLADLDLLLLDCRVVTQQCSAPSQKMVWE